MILELIVVNLALLLVLVLLNHRSFCRSSLRTDRGDRAFILRLIEDLFDDLNWSKKSF